MSRRSPSTKQRRRRGARGRCSRASRSPRDGGSAGHRPLRPADLLPSPSFDEPARLDPRQRRAEGRDPLLVRRADGLAPDRLTDDPVAQLLEGRSPGPVAVDRAGEPERRRSPPSSGRAGVKRAKNACRRKTPAPISSTSGAPGASEPSLAARSRKLKIDSCPARRPVRSAPTAASPSASASNSAACSRVRFACSQVRPDGLSDTASMVGRRPTPAVPRPKIALSRSPYLRRRRDALIPAKHPFYRASVRNGCSTLDMGVMMELSTLLVVCSGTVVVGILALQAGWGTLARPSSIGSPTSSVATRPDLRPLPRPVVARRGRSRRAA